MQPLEHGAALRANALDRHSNMTPVSPRKPAPSSRVAALDGLRICAISLVVVSHVQDSKGFPKVIADHWYFEGLGVLTFLLLSGFVVTRLLLRTEQKQGRITLSSFYLRRWWRLLPPVVVFLAACLVMQALHWTKFSTTELLASLTFTRNLVEGNFYTGHLWSLGVQEQFYLIWPALLILTPARYRLGLAIALVIAQPVWAALSPRWLGPPTPGIGRLDLRAFPLLCGVALALAHEQKGLRDWLRHPLLGHAGIFLLGLGMIVLLRSGIPPGPPRLWRLAEYVCLALILNQLVVGPDSVTARFLALPFMVWLGQQAFQIYIWQQIFVTNGELPFQFLPLNLLLLAAMATVTFFLVEKPLMRLRTQYEERRKRTAAVALA